VSAEPLGDDLMAILREYDVVRVVRLANPDRFYDGTETVMRPPRIGDVATICHENEPCDPSGSVVVEMVDQDGMTIWLANFARDELELVGRP
jgi:hypothetical protein